jgi:hypothetical protein
MVSNFQKPKPSACSFVRNAQFIRTLCISCTGLLIPEADEEKVLGSDFRSEAYLRNRYTECESHKGYIEIKYNIKLK